MTNTPEENKDKPTPNTEPSTADRSLQEKSDPQLTELRGFTDPSEDLEPTLTDGTKAPDNTGSEEKETE